MDNKEKVVDLKAAEEVEKTEEKEEKPGVYVHHFTTPQKYNGKEIESIILDYNKITGKSFIKIEQEMTDQGSIALDPMLSRAFQAKLAAKAAGVGADFIESLGAVDFYKITSSARNFLVDLA